MKPARIAVLCTLLLTCSEKKDTNAPPRWGRTLEPRLSVAVDWQPCHRVLDGERVVARAHCGGTPISSASVSSTCDVTTHTATLRTLSTRTDCTDAVIDALLRFSEKTPAALSDLAAAYYVRAQVEDRPQDLLTALDHADRALALIPQSSDALFNRALIEEALAMDANAIASWDAFRAMEKSTPWTTEATNHRNALSHKTDGARQWELNVAQLRDAARGGDRKKVRALIEGFPAAAQRWMEEEVLPQWDLQVAGVVAEEWSQVTKDPYLVDAVRAAQSSNDVEALKKGYAAFKAARTRDTRLHWEEAGKFYRQAIQPLTRGGSPLRLAAALGLANATIYDDEADALTSIDRIEPEARRYPSLLTRIFAARALALTYVRRGAESVDAYQAAIALAPAVRDYAGLVSFQSAKAEALLQLGAKEFALREWMTAARGSSRIVRPREMQRLFRVAGHIASAMDHPGATLRYTSTDLNYQQRHGEEGQQLLPVSLQGRAEAEVALGQFAEAQNDIDHANRLIDRLPKSEEAVARALRARSKQVEGQLRLRQNPARGIVALTEALASARDEQTSTFKAGLYALRAEAYRKSGRAAEAGQDYRNALDEIRREEESILANRERGKHDELWSEYFDRFTETHHQLIRHLLETGRTNEAFDLVEGRRAVEPLHLILELPLVPRRFRELLGDDLVAAREDLQAVLPPGTFLIEYLVLDDQTLAWVISRDAFEVVPLAPAKQQIERWAETLQTAAEDRDFGQFRAALIAPYQGLIAPPLARIERMQHGRDPLRRLVFIPDGDIHGIPFAALRNPDTEQPVIRHSIVEIAGSATLYAFSLLRDEELAAENFPTSVLLLANPAEWPALQLKKLPGAEAEVREIAELYGATPLIGSKATPDALFAHASSSTIVHIAGHAVPNPQSPSQSYILLASDAKEHGAVRALDLTKKARLDATRLFVFSACSTAGGAAVGPEGLAPLVRPVIGAGVPSVIGTLWSVRDHWARTLLVRFHNHYLSGRDVAAALRAAQLEFLNPSDPRQQPELAWAAFQAIGHATSPYAPAPQTTRRNQP